MKISKDNNKVIDLNKVQWAELLWCCHSLGRTYKRHKKPTEPTVNGHEFDYQSKFIPTLEDFVRPIEISFPKTLLDLAIQRNMLDHWRPELTLQLTANHSLVYTGQKALDLWKAWNAHIFGKRKIND